MKTVVVIGNRFNLTGQIFKRTYYEKVKTADLCGSFGCISALRADESDSTNGKANLSYSFLKPILGDLTKNELVEERRLGRNLFVYSASNAARKIIPKSKSFLKSFQSFRAFHLETFWGCVS
jgi:hypothetical protein